MLFLVPLFCSHFQLLMEGLRGGVAAGAAVPGVAHFLKQHLLLPLALPCMFGCRFTSPALSTDSTDCIPRFSSVQPYSSIAFNTLAGDSSISFAAAAADAASCQAACSSNCHFWVFRTQQTDGSDGCWLKNTTANPSADTYMAYKVAATSDYIVWPANAGE